MEFFVDNWYLIVAAIVLVVSAVLVAVKFFKLPSSEQLDKVREWLLYATTVAEKELGSGTGKLKLRYVYDLFVVKFPWIAKVITFDMFSELVDEALEGMNALLSSNAAVQLYVNGPSDTEDTEAAG